MGKVIRYERTYNGRVNDEDPDFFRPAEEDTIRKEMSGMGALIGLDIHLIQDTDNTVAVVRLPEYFTTRAIGDGGSLSYSVSFEVQSARPDNKLPSNLTILLTNKGFTPKLMD